MIRSRMVEARTSEKIKRKKQRKELRSHKAIGTNSLRGKEELR